jgi:hypothetical protein
MSCELGHRTGLLRHSLQASHHHQVPGFGGIYGGLEGSLGDYARPRTRALGDAI